MSKGMTMETLGKLFLLLIILSALAYLLYKAFLSDYPTTYVISIGVSCPKGAANDLDNYVNNLCRCDPDTYEPDNLTPCCISVCKYEKEKKHERGVK